MMMIIGSSNILFSLSASRLPKSGDAPKVQGAGSDFGIPSSQVIENKMRKKSRNGANAEVAIHRA